MVTHRKKHQLAASNTFAVEEDTYELLLKSMGVATSSGILAKEKLIAIDPTTKAILVKWIDSVPIPAGVRIVAVLEALEGDDRLRAEAIWIIDAGDYFTGTDVEIALAELALGTAIVADAIKDYHIDWGTGANQVSGVDVPIADAGGIITATEVEGALQEIMTDLDTAEAAIVTAQADIITAQAAANAAQADIDGFPDELENLLAAEIQQLENIDAVTITNAQWGYLGVLDQALATSDDVEFASLVIDEEALIKDDISSFGNLYTNALITSAYLSLDGNGWAFIADVDQKGLDMGFSDFMLEFWFKNGGHTIHQSPLAKGGFGNTGYYTRIPANESYLNVLLDDPDGHVVNVSSASGLTDNGLHYAVLVVDRSGNAQWHIDGIASGDPVDATALTNLDCASDFAVGAKDELGSHLWIGSLDEVHIWNFGYGGLPADYADYIAWRYTHPHAPLSEYNSGSWLPYDDADRTEKVTDPGIENWTGNNPDDWEEWGLAAGVRDIFDEGVQVHGGAHAAKLEATLNDGTAFAGYQETTLVANKYYELSGWIYFPTRTAGTVSLYGWNPIDTYWVYAVAGLWPNAAYTWYGGVGMPTIPVQTDAPSWVFNDETTTGIAYFDDMSIKRVGLVAHWKFNGDYTDETTNANDLTEGGTGNAFVGGGLTLCGDLDLSNLALDILIKDNEAAALEIKEGANPYLTFVTTDGGEKILASKLLDVDDGILLSNIAMAAAPVDHMRIGSVDLSAGNTMLAIYGEGTCLGAGTPAQDRTIAIEVEGTTYYILASTLAG